MINYGLDGDQEDAIKWAIAKAEDIRKTTHDDLDDVNRERERFTPFASSNKQYYARLEKNHIVLVEKLARINTHIKALQSLVTDSNTPMYSDNEGSKPLK